MTTMAWNMEEKKENESELNEFSTKWNKFISFNVQRLLILHNTYSTNRRKERRKIKPEQEKQNSFSRKEIHTI